MDNTTERNWIEYSGKPSTRSRVIKRIIRLGSRMTRNKSLEEARTVWESFAGGRKVPLGFEVNSIDIDGVECEWIIPKADKGEKTLIYLHGGGYVTGTLSTARGFAIQVSKYTSQRVLTVGYRLAPENPFPAALEDSLAVYHSFIQQVVNANDIVLIGDSAGGGLALATVLSLKENGEALPGAVVCISPWTDLAATGESNTKNAKIDPIFGQVEYLIKPENYADTESLFNPLISPLYGDYSDFPPLLIHVGTDEVILDDSIRLAEKAREAGVKVSLKVWRGMWHVFTTQNDILTEGKQSLKEISEFINRCS
ncbi:MAG: alpha/beta hydrolase [Bacillota bacterium]|nr:alpha/beta hydrolase [Bacillota bacterium]